MKNKKYLILLPSLILSSCNFKNTILYLGENILINEERITTLLKKNIKISMMNLLVVILS